MFSHDHLMLLLTLHDSYYYNILFTFIVLRATYLFWRAPLLLYFPFYNITCIANFACIIQFYEKSSTSSQSYNVTNQL